MKYKILAIDDEENILTSLELAFRSKYEFITAQTGSEAIKIVSRENINVIFLDLNLPDIDGLRLLKHIKQINVFCEVIVITAKSDVDTAVNAMKKGAFDYVVKPYDMQRLYVLVEKAIEGLKLKSELSYLKQEKEEANNVKCDFIGISPQAQNLRLAIKKLSFANSTILIIGESGTGKEVVARSIHYMGRYKTKPFVPIHTGAIAETLIESELFGYEKGAFTGASTKKIGKFEYANGGTLFLDEINTMPLHLQVKLLRVLQERCFTRVGGTVPIKVNVRIIAASNVDLNQEVQCGRFRGDLFYRLNVVTINIPPLRERFQDIKILSEFFLARYSRQYKKIINGFSPEAMEKLEEYHWAGNVRELENIVERIVVLSDNDTVLLEDLPLEFSISGFKNIGNLTCTKKTTKENFENVEKQFLQRTLIEHNWNKAKSAESLGIHRNTILYKIKKYNLEKG
ncbi:MAG: hypothetical protein ACD_79C01527G0018 [uncultured bacterium]|nr:MAG: hypothetical protein ACD_79C01527G0018 [uncultured bacterium]